MMSDQEDKNADLWAYVTKSVTPIDRSKLQNPAQTLKKDKAILKNKPPQKPLSKTFEKADADLLFQGGGKKAGPHQNISQSSQLNASLDRKLKRGKIEIEDQIDLHGLTKETAYIMLKSFIEQSVQRQCRCVLVITGQGQGALSVFKGFGVLRTALPEWLRGAALSPYVLDFTTAKQKHGGNGAFYVYLKRKKSAAPFMKG